MIRFVEVNTKYYVQTVSLRLRGSTSLSKVTGSKGLKFGSRKMSGWSTYPQLQKWTNGEEKNLNYNKASIPSVTSMR